MTKEEVMQTLIMPRSTTRTTIYTNKPGTALWNCKPLADYHRSKKKGKK